ncbi:hypothetical protein ACFV9G_22025 [Nocardioides sp. NPDC059952]|uniref:hypothetical protein n=1 Tax=Nocardioides sp. NPDC059952 TaxID=3347014 RepID=UPI0036618E4B
MNLTDTFGILVFVALGILIVTQVAISIARGKRRRGPRRRSGSSCSSSSCGSGSAYDSDNGHHHSCNSSSCGSSCGGGGGD